MSGCCCQVFPSLGKERWNYLPRTGPDSLPQANPLSSMMFVPWGLGVTVWSSSNWGQLGLPARVALRLLINPGLLHFLPWPPLPCLERAASPRVQGTPFPRDESQPRSWLGASLTPQSQELLCPLLFPMNTSSCGPLLPLAASLWLGPFIYSGLFFFLLETRSCGEVPRSFSNLIPQIPRRNKD